MDKAEKMEQASIDRRAFIDPILIDDEMAAHDTDMPPINFTKVKFKGNTADFNCGSKGIPYNQLEL